MIDFKKAVLMGVAKKTSRQSLKDKAAEIEKIGFYWRKKRLEARLRARKAKAREARAVARRASEQICEGQAKPQGGV